MAFSAEQGGDSGFTEPNVVPLVDVMLVLLIIFMVTAPLMTHKVKIDLPEATIEERLARPPAEPITVAVRETGETYWNDERVPPELLESRLAVEAQKLPQPQVQVRADAETRYALIQDVTTKVRLAGIRSIAFVSEPEQ